MMSHEIRGIGPKSAELPSLFREKSLENEKGEIRDRESLRNSCQEFEGILLGMIWKSMLAHARTLDGKEDERPFGIMEDMAVEMAADSVSKAGGVGLWKMLYAQLAETLPQEIPSEDL
ncbi:MAG TPA: hypothetical protein PK364_03585 [Synergistaceae bacterium]|nr:hypothetical protein [Synergistaceae bacterium]HPJ25176.1 hypothetical protein [Synergistaceae bacterium]HPQ36752.1 hypothetical protein [Synergistaceae bacterium]